MTARLHGAGGLHLARTLHSGQAFRWTWEASALAAPVAIGVVGRHVVRIRQDDTGLWLLAPQTAHARADVASYLGLAAPSRPIDDIETALSADAVLTRVLPHTRGLGILRQDPWEVLVSFIISANNNIPKIRQSIERLARTLGEPLEHGVCGFPTPERLARAHARTLAACLLGYRAPYVRAAARLVADGRIDLGALPGMSPEQARECLLGVPGVGEKVADCVLLFGLRHTTAFPVDVWVQRAVERLYFRGRPRTMRQIQEFARARFGSLAGHAQQHLFCYARAHLRKNGKGPDRARPSPRTFVALRSAESRVSPTA